MPKSYKKINIKRHYRANKVTSNFEQEILIIKAKYIKADYPDIFINLIISNFIKTKKAFLLHQH